MALALMAIAAIYGQAGRPGWWWASLLPNIGVCLCIVHTVFGVVRLAQRWLPPPLVARMFDLRDWRAGLGFGALALFGILLGMTIGFTIVPMLVERNPWGLFISLPAALTKFGVFLLFLFGANWAWWRSRLRQQELQREATEARLRLLQGQIEPHLLFNTLANVQSLMDYDPPRAKRMLEVFSGYLRAGLSQLRQADSTVGAELDMAHSYLSLLEIRMEERLRFRIEASEQARGALMPSLMLQPLVENAIHHGLELKLDDAARARCIDTSVFFHGDATMFKPALLLSMLCLSSMCRAGAPVIDTIGGRQVESVTLRRPSSRQVVVFESGSRGTLDKWGAVLEQVGAHATVFAYNRPGYGNSQVTTTARDGRTIVAELRQLLRHKGLRPPYVLVGHSLGGLYMQQFARAHPDEVEGLVLVDAMYPRMIKNTADFPWLTRLAGRLAFSRTVWREIEKIDDTGEAVLALGAIDDKPIVRLVNQPTSSTAIAVDFGAFRMDGATRDMVRAMYPKAKTTVVDSSHQMALTDPGIVTAAIVRVMAPPGELARAGY